MEKGQSQEYESNCLTFLLDIIEEGDSLTLLTDENHFIGITVNGEIKENPQLLSQSLRKGENIRYLPLDKDYLFETLHPRMKLSPYYQNLLKKYFERST